MLINFNLTFKDKYIIHIHIYFIQITMFSCSFATLEQAFGEDRMTQDKIKAGIEQARIKREEQARIVREELAKIAREELARIAREKEEERKRRNSSDVNDKDNEPDDEDSEQDSDDITDSYTKIDLVVN